MDIDPELLKQLIETFKSELAEQIQSMSEGLIQLEHQDISSKEKDAIIQSIFRSAHNVKGTSRSLNITTVADIAHHIESIFSRIQQEKLVISTALINLCLNALDHMSIAMQCFLNGEPLSFDLAVLLEQLEKTSSIPPPSLKKKVQKDSQKDALPIHQTKENPFAAKGISEETIRVSLENIANITALMEEMQANKIAIHDHYRELNKVIAYMKQLPSLWQQIKSEVHPEENEKLNKIFNVTQDILLDMNHNTQQLHHNMRNRLNELDGLSHALSDEIQKLRLIPAENLLRLFPRIVRDLAQEMNKQVELVMSGHDVKMDKMILESLKDPIIHLLRNAIDHGIEDPVVRQEQGKPKIGKIWLKITDEGHQIRIRIKDDGAGIDVNKIRELAIKTNILKADEADHLDKDALLDLIFAPGFSTKEIITQISGRGVGLNVVKENIQNLKGQVFIKTKLGNYTQFDLYLPLTLTGERGLTIRSGGQLFVMPTAYVERVLSLNVKEVVDIADGQALVIEGHSIPLYTLSEVLSLEKIEFSGLEIMPALIVKKGNQKIALVIDDIIGEREVVIKPLQFPLQHLKGISGGTLSGNGEVLIVLNPNDLIQKILQFKGASRIVKEDDKSQAAAKINILIADDSITTRTLEKSILEGRGYQVTVAVDGKEAWDYLQKQVYSLLITDVMMPNMDGFTLTSRVKHTDKLKQMPVIIVTSLGSEGEKKRGIEAGADAYIIKNEFESQNLLTLVEQLV